MNSEFNWWLLIVGLVVGAGLVWLVVADSRRREVDVDEAEREGEARWIADAMTNAGRSVNDDDVIDILRLHAAYLAAAPPDEPFEAEPFGGEPATGSRQWAPVRGMEPVAGDEGPARSMARPAGASPSDEESGPA